MKGRSYPFVVLVDPAFEKIYGAYSHDQLKDQEYRKIFRDARKAAKTDITEKKFNVTIGANNQKNNRVAEKEDKPKENSKEVTSKTSDSDVIKIENPKMRTWRTAYATDIRAKLIAVENKKTFVFETDKGKTVRATAKNLSMKAAEEARFLAKIK